MVHLPPEAIHFVLLDRDIGNDLALENVLADIPFLTVGILAFCTLTFLTLTKRLGIMLATLHLSIIAAWVAATLDLSQIWQRGRLNTDLGLQLDSVQPIIVTREIGYALSNSLRFFFFWIFVTKPPKAERPCTRAGTHSNSWNAWGFIGVTLRWLTLCLVLSVFALQVAWRLDNGSDKFTNIYTAESAIEVLLSAVLAFKLLLNCASCTVVSKWICALDYLGFFISLLFSVGFGIANLAFVKFTESILGRFLQGVSLYVLVLSSLLLVFLPPWESKSRRVQSIRLISPKQPASPFNIPPPSVSTPDLSVQTRPDSPTIHRPQLEQPPSAAQISGWLTTQKQTLSDVSDRDDSGGDNMNVEVWNPSRAELDQSFREETPKGSDVFKEVYGHPDSYLGIDPFQPPPIRRSKLEAPRLGRGFAKSATTRHLDLSLPPPETVDRKALQANSPVFGLYGIIQPSTGESGLRPRVSVATVDSNQTSVVTNLIRKQEELDKSIAVLELLEGSVDLPSSPLSSKQSRGPSATQSDLSLSNFPDPPWSGRPDSIDFSEPSRSSTPVPTTQPLHLNPPSVNVDNVAFDLVPPRIRIRIPTPGVDYSRTMSVPVSDIADSEGTQYDVTSFIGNLTGSPFTPPPPSGHRKKNFPESQGGPEPFAKNLTLQQSKQTYLGSPFVRMPIVGPNPPGMLPAPRVTLPSKPKLDSGRPRPAFPPLRQDVSADTFEQSRAAPSTYQ